MAQARKTASKYPGFGKFGSDLKAGKIKPVLVLFGEEDFLIERAIEKLKARYMGDVGADFDIDRSDFQDPQDMVTSCKIFPLVSRKRLVIASGKDFLESKAKDRSKSIDNLHKYIESPSESTILLLTSDSFEMDSKIGRIVSSLGGVYQMGRLTERELDSFVKEAFDEHCLVLTRDVLEEIKLRTDYLNRESKYRLRDLCQDIDKLNHFVRYQIEEDEEILVSIEDVRAVFNSEENSMIFDLLNSVGEGNYKNNFRIIANLKNSKMSTIEMANRIAGQLELMYSIKELKSRRMSDQDCIAKMRLHERRFFYLKKYSERYDLKTLRHLLDSAYDVEYHIKSGNMDSDLALEFFVAKL